MLFARLKDDTLLLKVPLTTACEESCPADLIHLGALNKRTVLAAVLKDVFVF